MGNDQAEKSKSSKENIPDEFFDLLFELKMLSKTISKSYKIERENKVLIKKIAEYIKQREYELAKISSYEYIKNKNIIRKYRILSNKIENFSQKLKSAFYNNINIEQMQNFAQQLVYAGSVNDFNKIEDILIDIEQLYDDIDVCCSCPNYLNVYMPNTINEYDIYQLIEQIAKQNEINLSEEFDDDEQFNEEKEKNVIEQKQIKQVEVS